MCGQLIRHDDLAGTLHLQELGLGGALLRQTRHFLRDTIPPDWPDSVAARDVLLESADGATTSLRYAPSGELLRQIDALGNLQSFAYTVTAELKITRLTLTGDDQREKTLVSDLRYNASGQIESETAGNGVITRHRYDPADGRLIGISAHKTNGTPLQDLKYRYDAVGNLMNLEDAAQPIRYFNNQRIEPIKTYHYDTLDQLIEATGWEAMTGHGGPALPDLQPLPLDPNQVAQYSQTFHYDAGGNLLDLTHVGAQPHSRTLTRAQYSNRCLSERNGRPPTEEELAAGFDANGNLRELIAGQSLAWDLRNQLSTVRPVVRKDDNDDYERYLYDGGGQRVRKLRSNQTNARTLINEVRYLPSVEIRSHGGTGEILHVINASAGSNSVQVLHWVAKPPENILNDQVRYSLCDHLKSSALELDEQTDLISQEWYYPFGGTACFAARSATEAKYKTVRYSGKERDATGLYYYGFRYYAPWLQRWINPDPAGYVDGMNLFAMVNNNPMTYLDLQGNISSEFNPEQYLAEFKAIITNYRPLKKYSNHIERTNHYTTKLYKINSISTKSDINYFKRQIRKLESTLLNRNLFLNSLHKDLELRHFNHYESNIKIAKTLEPLKPYLPTYIEATDLPINQAAHPFHTELSLLRASDYPPAYLGSERLRTENHYSPANSKIDSSESPPPYEIQAGDEAALVIRLQSSTIAHGTTPLTTPTPNPNPNLTLLRTFTTAAHWIRRSIRNRRREDSVATNN
ncbi:putative deoxyribonuclease RhsA [compost metagenome]